LGPNGNENEGNDANYYFFHELTSFLYIIIQLDQYENSHQLPKHYKPLQLYWEAIASVNRRNYSEILKRAICGFLQETATPQAGLQLV
jgi:hypothetical protein